jgi:adenylate kinase family enzyme
MILDDLGPRICIMGSSNSGKSTLTTATARARDLQLIHLDRLYHRPSTDWEARPAAEFIALHDKALSRERWVVDGNYTRCLPQRLARAKGVILLDTSRAVSLFRYLRRCWSSQHRLGGLEGGHDSVKWSMIHHIAITTRANRKPYQALFDAINLPKIRLSTPTALAAIYRSERLDR